MRALFAIGVSASMLGCSGVTDPVAPENVNQLVAAVGLPDWAALRTALLRARREANGGFNLDMWATIVDRNGTVLAVAFSGNVIGDQWPGSRAISAQKAYTANAFSLPGLALSTANLYTATQPTGTLFGLQHSNPVDPSVAYKGPPELWGQRNDPLVGLRMGGINVFGGGLALYDSRGRLIGGLGLSGDSSCADHNIAWKVRDYLGLDYVPNGVSPTHDDNIIYDFDVETETSPSGWGHPTCSPAATAIGQALPKTHPISHHTP